MEGEVFEYIGPTLTDGDPNTDGIQTIDLSIQSYQDKSAWRPMSLGASPAQTQARILDSSIQASGTLTLDAAANQTINAIVVAGAVALSGGGTTGVGVSGAGVYTENKIKTLVTASINGDGANTASDGITASSVSLNAQDASVINAVAGAASVAGSVGGTTGVSVAIGLSLAFNEISNEVHAHISNADEGVFTAPGGDIKISAASLGQHLFDLSLSGLLSAASLDNAAEANQDDPDSDDKNEATADAKSDKAVLEALRSAMNAQLAAQGLDLLAIYDTVGTASMYKTTDTDDDGAPLKVDLREGTTVEMGTNANGVLGRVYRYIGADRDEVNLATENYLAPGNWLLVEPLKLTILEEGERWSLVAPDGQTFMFEKSGNTLKVGRDTINAISAAAAFAASFGGTAGVAVSGAGAVAQNVVLTKVNAFADASRLGSSTSKVDDVDIDARSDSTISSTVVAAALAIGGGGTAGVGVSIGIGVAQNFIGWQPGESTPTPAEVQAYLKNTSVQSTGAITQDAIADQTINSTVLAGSVAVGLGGTAGVGVAGSGVWSENRIAADVMAYIDGDGTDGILADSVTLTALDTSSINAFAGAASLAASVGGTAGVSVAIGVSLAKNIIASHVATYIANADNTVRAGDGDIRLLASESATIDAVSAAASIAAGFGGTAGIAISGAGAEATNVILTRTNAYVEGSTLSSDGDVDIDATNTSSIDATIITASVSLAIGGTVGVGASIGAALATNLIGFTEAGTRQGAEVQAYIEDSSVLDAGSLTLDAVSDLTVDANVFAGSVAIAGGTVGVGVAGAGASSKNRIGADVRAYIDGYGGSGITVESLAVNADDTSHINADTGAASVAASFGVAGASVQRDRQHRRGRHPPCRRLDHHGRRRVGHSRRNGEHHGPDGDGERGGQHLDRRICFRRAHDREQHADEHDCGLHSGFHQRGISRGRPGLGRRHGHHIGGDRVCVACRGFGQLGGGRDSDRQHH